MHVTKEIEEFPRRLASWRRSLGGRRMPPALPLDVSVEDFVTSAVHLERRYREGPDAPLRLAIFGPTGAGKSKVFNSLLGRVSSPSGFHRPFTRNPVHALHASRRELAAVLEGEVVLHSDHAWRDVLLIDTPDFDSVEVHNREEAERVFLDADAFLFVTDVEKYADAATWEYLERIFIGGKPCRVILNKVRSPGAGEDLLARLEARWGERGRRAAGPFFPELPMDDATLFAPGEPALAELRELVSAMSQSRDTAREIVCRAFRLELERFFGGSRSLLASVRRMLETREELRDRIRVRFQETGERLKDLLRARVDPNVRAEMYNRVLERLERIDIFRYPRRLLALPYEGIKLLVERWRGPREGTPSPAAHPVAAMDSFQILEGALLTAGETAREAVESAPGFRELMDLETYVSLRLSHAELQALYERKLEEFRDWVARTAREMATELSGESKARFILSQVIFNTILIGVQLKTAGMFSLAEMAADGVLSPMMAKAAGMAVSSAKVREFEALAHDRHHQVVLEIVDAGRERFEDFLERATAGLEELRDLLEETERYAQHAGDLAGGFERRRYSLEGAEVPSWARGSAAPGGEGAE